MAQDREALLKAAKRKLLLEKAKQKLRGESETQSQDISVIESAGRGFQQGATAGLADEIGGVVNAGLHLGSKVLPYDSPYESTSDAYTEGRNTDREIYKQAEMAHPGAYNSADLVGTIATSLIPGVGVASKGASGALKLAGQGAVEGFGRSESDSLAGLAIDTGAGAGTAVALGTAVDKAVPVVGAGVDKVYKYLSKKAKDIAKNRTAKALGYTKSMRKGREDQVMDVAQEALDRNVVTHLASTEDIVSRVKNIEDSAAQGFKDTASEVNSIGISLNKDRLVNTTDNIKEGISVDGKSLAGDLIAKLKDKYYNPKVEPGVSNKFRNLMSEIFESVDSPEGISKLKTKINRYGWNEKGIPRDTIEGEMYRDIWRALQDQYGEAIGIAAKEANDPNILNKYLQAKKDYKFSKALEKPLEEEISKKGNRMVGLTDVIVGGSALGYGGTTGDWTTAIGIAALKKGADKWGNTLSAVTADKLSKALSNPQFAAKYGPMLKSAVARGGAKSLEVSDFLLQSKDQEYRQAMQEENED